jgi:hypothetical protein
MIAAAITRMLKLDPLIRMIAGCVSVADTRYSVSDTLAHLSKRHAKAGGLALRGEQFRPPSIANPFAARRLCCGPENRVLALGYFLCGVFLTPCFSFRWSGLFCVQKRTFR